MMYKHFCDNLKRHALIFSIIILIIMALTGCGTDVSDGSQLSEAVSGNNSLASESELSVQETGVELEPEPSSGPQAEQPDQIEGFGNGSSEPDPAGQSNTEPGNEELVRVTDFIPNIFIDLKYASTDNFTGRIIYDFNDAYLRYGTVKKLRAVQEELESKGYSLKIWDAYRPVSAQFKLWEVCPDPVYVADPNTGYSSHSKGNTVDVTMVLLDGTTVVMPSKFDDFSSKADRDYSDVSAEAGANAGLLEKTMSAHGFNGYSGEWWHFSDSTSYDVVKGDGSD